MNEAIAQLIERSELSDSTLVSAFPRFSKTQRPRKGSLTSSRPIIEVCTTYIDPGLFAHGFNELVSEDN